MTTYDLNVSKVQTDLAAHRQKLADAWAAKVATAQERVAKAETFPQQLADFFTQQAALLTSGELAPDRYGDLRWADKNRTDELPYSPEVRDVDYEKGHVREIEERANARLKSQDAHITFVDTIGTKTVTVERWVYEGWFIPLP